MFRPRRQRGGNLGLLLLGYQMMSVGFNHIPPVTLATIGAQVAIFLGLLDIHLPSVSDVCISALTVWYRHDWKRLFLSAFFHADDMHLYFNMVSFMWKGRSLERNLGSGYFLYMLAVFTLLTNATLVGLNMALEHVLGDPRYISQCAVGFSGVVFALKVVTTHLLPPGVEYVMGFIPMPTRYVCWAELALIQILVPNASFTGHLAGILVGLAYVKGPLKYIMDTFAPVAARQFGPGHMNYSGASGYRGGWFRRGAQRQQYQAPPGAYPPYQPQTQFSEDYAAYTGGLDEDAQMQEAMRESMNEEAEMQEAIRASMQQNYQLPAPSAPPTDQAPHNGGLYPNLNQGFHPSAEASSHHRGENLEDIRRRRLARLQQT